MKLLKDSYKEAKRLLKDNRELMDTLAEFLIEKETITGKEFMKIFREAKGPPEPEEKVKDTPVASEDVTEETATESAEEVETPAETADASNKNVGVFSGRMSNN